MKHLILIMLIALNFNAIAQDDKTVTLVVSGSGKTQDEAKQNALRSAIEQAFGTFISSKTEILNDSLVKDEIVSVSNGNIQMFEVISEIQIPDGGFATTLNATVSVTKLTSFVESKGVEVEFKGALFAMNIKLLKLNAEAEYKAILDLCNVSKEILSKGLDYSLQVSEPQAYEGSTDKYTINFEVNCKANNIEVFEKYFWSTLPKIAMTTEEKLNYDKIKVPVSIIIKQNTDELSEFWKNYDYSQFVRIRDTITVNNNIQKIKLSPVFLRNPKSLLALKNLFIKSNDFLFNFRITSEVDTISVKKCCSFPLPITNNLKRWALSGGYPNAGSCSENNSALGIFENGESLPEFLPLWNLYYRFFEASDSNDVEKLLGENSYYTTNSNSFSWRIGNSPASRQIITYLRDDEWSYFLKPDLVLHTGNPLVLYEKPSPSSFTFNYIHVLDFNSLGKISRYKIEPFQNKL